MFLFIIICICLLTYYYMYIFIYSNLYLQFIISSSYVQICNTVPFLCKTCILIQLNASFLVTLFLSELLQGEILMPTYNTNMAAGFTDQMNSTVHVCYLRTIPIDYLHHCIKLKIAVYSANICNKLHTLIGHQWYTLR